MKKWTATQKRNLAVYLTLFIGLLVYSLVVVSSDDSAQGSKERTASTESRDSTGEAAAAPEQMISEAPAVTVNAADVSNEACTRDLRAIRRCLDDIDLAIESYAIERFERDWTAYEAIVQHLAATQGELLPKMRSAFAEQLDKDVDLSGFSARCNGSNCRTIQFRSPILGTKKTAVRFYFRFESELERLRFDFVEFRGEQERYKFGLESPEDGLILKWLEKPTDGWVGLDARSDLPGYVRIRVGERPKLTYARIREVFAYIERERGDFAIPFRDQPKYDFYEKFPNYSEYASWRAMKSYRDHDLSFAVVLVGPEKCAAIAQKVLPRDSWDIHSCDALGSAKNLPTSDDKRLDEALDSLER